MDRYDLIFDLGANCACRIKKSKLKPDPAVGAEYGEWVKYADAEAALTALRQQNKELREAILNAHTEINRTCVNLDTLRGFITQAESLIKEG